MRCEDILNQLNARADGELSTEECAVLDAHLAECASCRAAVEGLPALDAELRRALAGRRAAAVRLAESVTAAMRASTAPAVSTAPAPATAPAAPQLAWGQILVAVAAGFLLAVALFRPWKSSAVDVVQAIAPPVELAPIGQLAVASGPVEVQAASQIAVFRCPPATPLARDSIVRTGPTERCEIAMQDGNALRLDCNTEVALHDSELVELNHGRLLLTCPSGNKGLEVQSAGGKVIVEPAAQLAVECQPPMVRYTVCDGQANVKIGDKSIPLGPGQQVRLSKGQLEQEPVGCDTVLETAWVNGVLALRESEHPELVERVNRLLANVGAAKLSLLYEDELRRLGDDGVPPLLAYLASTQNTPGLPQRATAARIVADMAQSRWIADLIALLTDPNADVRFHAARGLERLTGRDQGIKPQSWQSDPWFSCEPGHQKWRIWWAANRDRYPNARRDIPAPTSPPF